MRILIVIPCLILLIAFALSNQAPVRLGLWPTDILVDVPLSVAVLVASGIFFVLGAMMTWGGSLALRLRARRAEAALRRLEVQLDVLRGAGRAGAQGEAIQGGTLQGGAGVPVLLPRN